MHTYAVRPCKDFRAAFPVRFASSVDAPPKAETLPKIQAGGSLSRSFQFSSLSARQVIPSSQYSNLRTGCISQYVARVVGLGLSKKCLESNINKPVTRTNSLFPLCLIVLFNTLVVKFGCFGCSRRTRGVNSATTQPLW